MVLRGLSLRRVRHDERWLAMRVVRLLDEVIGYRMIEISIFKIVTHDFREFLSL